MSLEKTIEWQQKIRYNTENRFAYYLSYQKCSTSPFTERVKYIHILRNGWENGFSEFLCGKERKKKKIIVSFWNECLFGSPNWNSIINYQQETTENGIEWQ